MIDERFSGTFPATLDATWDEAKQMLFVRCAGIPDHEAVRVWKERLWSVAQGLPERSCFRVLVDLTGYDVDSVPRDVHFEQRTVIPEFFAAHGFLAGYLNLYAEKPVVTTGPANRRVVACATVHHDGFKMESYRTMFGRENDGYFKERSEAERWLTQKTVTEWSTEATGPSLPDSGRHVASERPEESRG